MIPLDHTDKFMKNNKVSDISFFRNQFNAFKKNKLNLITEKIEGNYNHIKENYNKQFLYELGYKRAFIYLTTDKYNKKCDIINSNFHFEKKYLNIYPKHLILGPEPNENYSQKGKKIGDISFEEETNESENIKNMRRQSPDTMTEEWIKINVNSKAEILNIENCYWISKNLISKLGRMSPNLKVLF